MQQAEQTPSIKANHDYWDALIDETTAADFICQSARTLQKWRVVGYGPKYFKSGRSVRYNRRTLRDWVEANRRRHTSE